MMECLPWEGDVSVAGYGRIYHPTAPGRRVYIHRAIWEAQYGPIPEGYDVHHECGNRSCANPHHLELKAKSEHTRDHQVAQGGMDSRSEGYDEHRRKTNREYYLRHKDDPEYKRRHRDAQRAYVARRKAQEV